MPIARTRKIAFVLDGCCSEAAMDTLADILCEADCDRSVPDGTLASYLRLQGPHLTLEWSLSLQHNSWAIQRLLGVVRTTGLSMVALFDNDDHNVEVLTWVGGRRLRHRLFSMNDTIVLTQQRARQPGAIETAAIAEHIVLNGTLRTTSAHALLEDVARRRAALPETAYLSSPSSPGTPG